MGKKVYALANSTEFEPQAGSLRWDAIREDYISQNLVRQKGQPAYTFRKLADAHKVSYNYLRQIAATQKWNDALKDRIEERKRQAVERIQGVALFDEIEIRTRQASYARLASSLAFKKLQSIKEKDVSKLSVKDAIELMKLGLSEERIALGIKDGSEPPPAADQRLLSDAQVFAVARRVIELKRGDDGSYGTDAAE
jgi:hypothetical protein